jgi:type I restriction enzyme, S subunit
MGGWTRQPLGRLASRISDGSHNPPKGVEMSEFLMLSSKNVFDDEISFDSPRYLSADDFKAEDRRTSIAAGDVLLTIVGTIGRTAVVPAGTPAFTLQRSVAVIKPDTSTVDPRFLMYSLMKSRDDLNSQARGVAQKGIYLEALREFWINHPTVPEQRRIVAILDEAFEGIATAKANAEKNLQNARDLARVAMRHALAAGADSWTESTIGDQVALQRGFDITKDQQRAGSVPVVSSGGIRSYHDTPMVRAPGVVMGRKGTLGKVFYLEEDFWPHDTTLWVKDFKDNDPRFVHRFFEVLDVRSLDSGAANPALNRNQVHPLPVHWPPLDEQAVLAERIDRLSAYSDELASIYVAKLIALDELKKSLLHQAFSGAL